MANNDAMHSAATKQRHADEREAHKKGGKIKIGVCSICGRYKLVLIRPKGKTRCHPVGAKRDQQGLTYCNRVERKNKAKARKRGKR